MSKKGITNILNNHLNLPTQVTFLGTNKNISYIYTDKFGTVGIKLRKTVNDNDNIK